MGFGLDQPPALAARYNIAPSQLVAVVAPKADPTKRGSRSRAGRCGEYQALPQKWKDLKAEIAARGEVIGSPPL